MPSDTNHPFLRWEDADGNTLCETEQYTFTLTGETTLRAVFEAKVDAPELPDAKAPFYRQKEIAITCPIDGATIYYTTDESTPSATGATSTRYEGPFTITDETTVKAIAVKDGWIDSEIAEAHYTETDVNPNPPAPAARPSLPFRDVAAGDWYYDAVTYVYNKGLMQGVAPDLFAPAQSTTRGMTVLLLYRMEREPAVTGTSRFPDVAADSDYAAAVLWGEQNGIVKGYGNGSFGPNDNVTREQLTAMLYRYAAYKAISAPATGDLSRFPDGGSASAYAVDALKWATGAGILHGNPDGTLNPTGDAGRAEIAALLARFCRDISS